MCQAAAPRWGAMLAGAWLVAACLVAPARPVNSADVRPTPPPVAAPPGAPVRDPAATPQSQPEVFESADFIVTFARAVETAEQLAIRFLGEAGKAWMIEDYNGAATFGPGQPVVIPKEPWNLAGVDPGGHQIVPILVYHNIGLQARGRLVIAADTFAEQMRYLKAQGYRVVSLRDFVEFASLRRQLPRRAVIVTFDDGWKPFRDYFAPVLRELGFPATLFIYPDVVGGRLGLSWEELRQLAREGFDIQAHSKTHGDLRRQPDESEEVYARRMRAELVEPLAVFQRQLGQTPTVLAYPYGAHDDLVVRHVRDAGYAAAFDVRRQSSPAFGPRLTLHRSQIYSDMTLEEFAKNLNVFNAEPIR